MVEYGVEERVHLFPSGHVSTELELFEGDEYAREKRLAGRQARLRIPTRGPAAAGPSDSGMPCGQLARNNNAADEHTCLENSARSDIEMAPIC